MQIDIVLTNTTPFHSSAPGEARVTLDGDFVGNKDRGSFPCVRTRTMPIRKLDTNGEGDGGVRYLPVMPGNTLRHFLRAAAADLIFGQWRGRKTLSIGAYAAMESGNASGRPDGVPPTFAESVRMGEHPFIGLFGGGPRMLEGRLKCDAAWAITPDSLPYLGDYEDYCCKGNLLSIEFKRRVDPVLRLNPEHAALIDNVEQSLAQWASDNVQDKPGAGENDDGQIRRRGLDSFSAHQFVIPGVHWLWRIALNHPTQAQIGLVLSAIQTVAGQVIGGMGAIGYGQIRIVDVLIDGEPAWNGRGFEESEKNIRAFEAFAGALADMDPQQVEQFAATAKTQDAKAKNKRGKTAEVA